MTDAAHAVAESPAENTTPASGAMALKVGVTDVGPCRKKVVVTVPEADITTAREFVVDNYARKVVVPGFRVGRVPRRLVESRFKQELADELKQRVLVQSLEQLTQESGLDPINEPDMDVETLNIPDAGDFEYSFEVEVRPDVAIPDLSALTLERSVRQVTDEDVNRYLQRMLADHGTAVPSTEPAAAGDVLVVDLAFEYKGKTVREMSALRLRVKPVLRFSDAEVSGFDAIVAGVRPGETRQFNLMVSQESPFIPMRNESLAVTLTVKEVDRFTPASVDAAFLASVMVESEEALRARIREVLERQVSYRQRQSARSQLLKLITQSAEWQLPESLVLKQVENAMHREVLEMRQAGYSPAEIRARENELRQKSVSTTTQAMKEHFVLDKIATTEKIEVSGEEMDVEIMAMAFQGRETPRRLRARLQKSGVIENLEAQIRERKAVDFALSKAQYKEIPMADELVQDVNVEGVEQVICDVMFSLPTG